MTDTATVTGSPPLAPTGTVSFYVCGAHLERHRLHLDGEPGGKRRDCDAKPGLPDSLVAYLG